MGPRRTSRAICRCGEGGRDRNRGGSAGILGGQKTHGDLATAGQFDIDLRQKLRIQQRAMENTVAAIDPVA